MDNAAAELAKTGPAIGNLPAGARHWHQRRSGQQATRAARRTGDRVWRGLSLAVGLSLSLAQSPREALYVVELNHTGLDQHTPPEPRSATEPTKSRAVAGAPVVHQQPLEPRRRPVQSHRSKRSKNQGRDQVGGGAAGYQFAGIGSRMEGRLTAWSLSGSRQEDRPSWPTRFPDMGPA
jgi:hypothetical protein